MWVLKQCTKCKEYKELSDFTKSNRHSFGVLSSCKACRSSYNKERREIRGEDYKEYRRDYYKKTCEQQKLHTKKWRENNREKVNHYNRERFKNAQSRLAHSISCAVRRGLTKKNKSSNEILGCSYEFFRQHIERQFKKGMTWDNYGEWHLDHIVPLASAETEENVYRLNHYTNFQPMWGNENMSKGAKIPEGHQPKLPI